MSEVRSELLVSDFDYDLPAELIAQVPLPQRDRSRLLVLNRETGEITHSQVHELARWLDADDLLVANNSRVIPAKLKANRIPSAGQIEFLLLSRKGDHVWSALARPAKKLRVGDRLALRMRSELRGQQCLVEVTDKEAEGLVRIHFLDSADDHLEDFGSIPLPPYIHAEVEDEDRYQTTYATVPGSAAAPTAGLHMTPALRRSLDEAGINWAEVTLHIGLDTFRPVTVEKVRDHKIHSEWCHVPRHTINAITRTQQAGRKVIALGTTAARTLESLGQSRHLADQEDFEAATSIFITPGYQWTMVDAMVTNFHLPRSTLLMMVSAFAGRDRILAAYREAIEQRYRFFSFGDAMLIV